jgi:hypothetical protein
MLLQAKKGHPGRRARKCPTGRKNIRELAGIGGLRHGDRIAAWCRLAIDVFARSERRAVSVKQRGKDEASENPQ